MTEAEYIAAEMAGVVVVTAVVACVFRRKKLDGSAVASGVVVGVVLGGLAIMGFAHRCHAGDPYRQAVLLGICAAIVLSVVRSRVIAGAVCLGIGGVMVLASQQFVRVVHTREYVGSPTYIAMSNEGLVTGGPQRIRMLLADAGVDQTVSYPVGWVTDSPLNDVFVREGIDDIAVAELREVVRLWHTPLTGLYGMAYEPVELWYPGGALKSGIGRIRYEVRSVDGDGGLGD